MKRYKIYALTAVAALGLGSCDSWLDVNDNPNSPGAGSVPPELSLPGSLTQPYRSFVGSDQSLNTLGNLFMNSWAGNVNAYTDIYTEEFNLNIDNAFYPRIWENVYLTTLGYTDIMNYPSDDYDNHKAIAKIMKAFYFQYLVDLYGDIPYSQAHDLSIPSPAYDDDQAIYRDLVVQLEDAVTLIENADTNDHTVSADDVVLNGDMDGWIRFANTLKLRLLLRESGVAASQAYITSEIGELVTSGAQFINADVTINPGYSDAIADKQNPFYRGYGFLVSGDPATGRNSTVASQHAIEYLSGTSPVGVAVADPRINTLFDPAPGGGFVGIEQGMSGDEAPDDVSFLGPGLIISSAQDGYIFTAAESLLLQAEAISRGYMAGDASGLFDAAIAASFNLLGNTPAQLTAYMGQINGTQLDYDAATNKIEAIMRQKYVALMGINGIESWIEYTRTGFPVTPLATTAAHPDKPNRLLYPASEYTGNSANVPNQAQSDAYTTKVFWDNN